MLLKTLFLMGKIIVHFVELLKNRKMTKSDTNEHFFLLKQIN